VLTDISQEVLASPAVAAVVAALPVDVEVAVAVLVRRAVLRSLSYVSSPYCGCD
jgi:hypothetical protein